MLATEILIREFVHEESHENISDEFRGILHEKHAVSLPAD